MSSHPDTAHAHAAHAHAAHGHGEGHHHVASAGLFLKVLIALLFLTGITVGASRVDFGSANMLIAMLIACVKASLVIAIFMHVWWDTAINKIMFLGSFLFLSLLFAFTLADQATRSWDGPISVQRAPVAEQWHHPALADKKP
ncbi:MAG: cytochrome C oxidase subunit IV family protein [Planctomycetes bacterium]|nr:cytochrome C oxidase subunit IV family protein [Planctomycetota bacterium]